MAAAMSMSMAMSSSALSSSAAVSSPMQLGCGEAFAVPRVVAAGPGSRGVGVVSSLCSSQGADWLIGQCSNLRQLKSGLVAGRSSTIYSCQSGLGVASISKIFSGFGGGGGKGFGGWGRGGGGGDGSGVPAAGEGSVGAPGGEASNSITEDVILLSVGVIGLHTYFSYPIIFSLCAVTPTFVM
ncbi:hypothetical protein KC19_8G066400 [Ceratodon purpureus]|uniref:Uncharacterized protein n=1 Tax=Ceratodon purpureus TaxID=3225 RepID=A0A8T0GZL2_CERPU|nr:hypothetical protein KC19_8G066400 [Ceratodon purpureus]